jgi:uncharacterized protein YndB with AHSA1/START domain
MTRWHSPAPLTVDRADADLRPGGAWSVVMRQPDDVVHHVRGVYREIDPPQKVVYTWAWEGGTFDESIVTVEFRERGSSTEVVVTHTGLPTDDDRARHEHGWIGCIDRLEQLFA